MLERALSKTFGEIATLFLVSCAFTLPIYFIHASIFREVHRVAELSPEIREFPEGRQVRGVAAIDLERERLTLWLVVALTLLFLTLVARAAQRIHGLAEAGGVPTVRDALRHVTAPRGPGRVAAGSVAMSAGIGAIFGLLILRIGTLITEMGSDEIAWAGTGLTRAAAAAIFLAITGGCIGAMRTSVPAAAPSNEKIDLY